MRMLVVPFGWMIPLADRWTLACSSLRLSQILDKKRKKASKAQQLPPHAASVSVALSPMILHRYPPSACSLPSYCVPLKLKFSL